MKGQIFISYSTKDVAVAEQIVQYLESNEMTCWIAPRNIVSGRDYTDMINEAITDCRAVVVVVSKKSVQSQWVKKELTTATSMNKLVIPFKISQVELPGGWQFILNNVQWIDATNNTVSKFHEIIAGIDHSFEVPVVAAAGRQFSWKVILPLVGCVIVVVVLLLVIHPWKKGGTVMTDVDDSMATFVMTADDEQSQTEVVPTKDKKASNDNRNKNMATGKVDNSVDVVTIDPNTTDIKVEEDAPKEMDVVPEIRSVSDKETPPVTVDPKATQEQEKARLAAQERAYKKKLSNAKRQYEEKKYKEALDLFEELAKEKPSDKSLTAYISECRKHLAQNN